MRGAGGHMSMHKQKYQPRGLQLRAGISAGTRSIRRQQSQAVLQVDQPTVHNCRKPLCTAESERAHGHTCWPRWWEVLCGEDCQLWCRALVLALVPQAAQLPLGRCRCRELSQTARMNTPDGPGGGNCSAGKGARCGAEPLCLRLSHRLRSCPSALAAAGSSLLLHPALPAPGTAQRSAAAMLPLALADSLRVCKPFRVCTGAAGSKRTALVANRWAVLAAATSRACTQAGSYSHSPLLGRATSGAS